MYFFFDCLKRKGDNTLYNVSTLELAQTICEIASKINDYDLSTKVPQQDLIALNPNIIGIVSVHTREGQIEQINRLNLDQSLLIHMLKHSENS